MGGEELPAGRARRGRRWLLGSLVGLAVGAGATSLSRATGFGVFGSAAAPPPLPRVGYLALYGPDDPAGAPRPYLEWFHEGLKAEGYTDGKNLIVEHRFAEGSAERLRDFAEELVRLPTDLIVAADTDALNVLGRVTSTVPVVMAISFDPVAFGQIESLHRPGKNFTGLSLLGMSLVPKQVELLKEAVPELTRLAVLLSTHPSARLASQRLAEATEAAQTMGIALQPLKVDAADDLAAGFEAATREHADALLVLPDLLLTSHARAIADRALASQLPAIADSLAWVQAGLFMAYAVSRSAMFQRAASYVPKILGGTSPAEIPVERPSRFELTVNLKTTAALGLTIPHHVLLQATEVIQ